MSQGIDNISNS